LGDRPVDMVQETVDCVFRIGELPDSNMVARRIGTLQNVTCASPEYFESYGIPKRIEDLDQHKAVHYFSSRTGRSIDWDFIVDGVRIEKKMAGKLSLNDGDAYVSCALQGCGMIQAPLFMVQSYLESGQLIEVLEEWKPESMPISVVYLHNRHLSPKVRVFVDWVAELFSNCHTSKGCSTDMNAAECQCHFVKNEEFKTIRDVVKHQNIAESVF